MGQGRFPFTSKHVSQCRLDLGTVKIQIGIAMSGPALADGSLLGYYNSGYICIGR